MTHGNLIVSYYIRNQILICNLQFICMYVCVTNVYIHIIYIVTRLKIY
jgi:hypothetical protein